MEMENSEVKDASQCVRVAVNIRPLVTPELLVGCTDCITVVPGEPQVHKPRDYSYQYNSKLEMELGNTASVTALLLKYLMI